MVQSRPWKLFGGGVPAGGVAADSVYRSRDARAPDVASPSGGEFDDLPEPVMVIDPAGRLIAANEPAFILGRRAGAPLDDELGVANLLDRLCIANGAGSPPWFPIPGNNWMDQLADLTAFKPGELIFELNSTSRRGSDGLVADIVVRLMDITPLAEALRSKAAAERHRDRFLKLLSHDMRSPLAAILTALKHPDLSDLPTAPREIIESASSRALSMIDSTVRLTRAECSDYRFVELDLCHVVEEAIDACWAKAKNAGVRIALNPCDQPFVIVADRTYLMEALTDMFADRLETSTRGCVLSCSLEAVSLNNQAAVQLRVGGANDDKEMVRCDDPLEGAHVSVGEDKPLALFRTVVARHHGKIMTNNATDLAFVIPATLPRWQATSATHKTSL